MPHLNLLMISCERRLTSASSLFVASRRASSATAPASKRLFWALSRLLNWRAPRSLIQSASVSYRCGGGTGAAEVRETSSANSKRGQPKSGHHEPTPFPDGRGPTPADRLLAD